jgi:hypothetical protein
MGTAIGLVGIGIGSTLLVYMALMLFSIEISLIFTYFRPHGPTNVITSLSCPREWAENKPGTISATVRNPSANTLSYNTQLEIYSSSPIAIQGNQQANSVPANEQATFSWVGTPSTQTGYFIVAHVEAISNEDARRTGYHMWPSSFTGSCIVRLVNQPDFIKLRLQASGSAFVVLLGSVLVFRHNRPRTRRHTIIGVVLTLLLLLVAGVPFIYLIAP